MQACRYALEVVAKHPIYLLVYVGFLSLMGLFITSGVYPPATSAGYESAEVPFAVIDRDQSDLSRSVAAFLEERGTSVEVADEARACQDAVATGLVDYLLIVPAGFEEGYLAAARDGGDGPRLETVFSFQSMAATLVDTQVNQYLGLVRAAAVLEPDASPEALVAQAEASAQKEPRIEEVSVPGAAVGSEAFVFYLMWSAYPLTVAVVVSVGILMGAFNRTDVRRRVAVSSTSGLGLGLQKAAAGLVVALLVWAVIMGIGLVAFGYSAFTLAPADLACVLAVELVFVLIPLAIAFLLGQLGCGQNPLLPRQDLNVRVCQPGRQSSGGGWIRCRCQDRMKSPGLPLQQVDVMVGRQGQHPVAAGCRHLQGLGADGPCGAQDGKGSHAPAPLLKAGSHWISSSMRGAQKITLSNRSSTPPWPGRMWPKSLIFRLRFT